MRSICNWRVEDFSAFRPKPFLQMAFEDEAAEGEIAFKMDFETRETRTRGLSRTWDASAANAHDDARLPMQGS